jgi:hypothetical protein
MDLSRGLGDVYKRQLQTHTVAERFTIPVLNPYKEITTTRITGRTDVRPDLQINLSRHVAIALHNS